MKLRNKKTGEVVKIDLPIIDGDGWKISADSLAELNEDWEDYEPKEEKPKRYRLKKDLPTFKAGDVFELTPQGSLVQITDGRVGVCAYARQTLEKFPNILEDWFEPIEPPEPLIKDEKIRKAVRAWAEAENCTSEMNLYYTLNRQEKYITFHNPQTGSELQLYDFDSPVFQEIREYTIDELCGEEEE